MGGVKAGIIAGVAVMALAGCSGGSSESGSVSSSPSGAGAVTTTVVCPLGKQLTSVTRIIDGDIATFVWSGDATPASGSTVLWSVTLGSVAQVGVKTVDGALASDFVFDIGAAEQTDVPGDPSIGGGQVALFVPTSALPKGAAVAPVTATLSIDGADVASCTKAG